MTTDEALDAAMAACPDQQISLGHWEPAITRRDMRRALEAAAPHIAAAERERIRQLADAIKITLNRPGNGPGHMYAVDVVPWDRFADLLTEGDTT